MALAHEIAVNKDFQLEKVIYNPILKSKKGSLRKVIFLVARPHFFVAAGVKNCVKRLEVTFFCFINNFFHKNELAISRIECRLFT